MSCRLTLAALVLGACLLAPAARAQNAQTRARRTLTQQRVDPRRRPVRIERPTEFQPGRSFVPRPLTAPVAQRRTFWVLSRRRAQIDRNGDFQPFGSLRFDGNDVIRDRRTSFRPRR